jgi:MFS family permease
MIVDAPSARGLLAARIVALVAFLDLFMQFPVVAPYAAALGASGAMVGAVVAVFSAANLIGGVAGGVVVDRWGRRGPLLVGLAITAAAILLYIPATTPGYLLAVRAAHGLTVAVLTVGAFAAMGDLAADGARARVMGRSGALIGTAAVLGPLLAGVLRDLGGFSSVFLTVALMMLLALAVVWRWGIHSVEAPRPVAGAGRRLPALLGRPPLAAAYASALSYTVGLGVLVAHLALVMQATGASAVLSGAAFGVFALAAVAAMLSPATGLSDRRGHRGPLAAGLGLMAAGLVVLAAAASAPAGAMAGMAVLGLGFGFFFPAATALVAEGTNPCDRGTGFGIFFAIYSLGTVIGATLAGLLTQWQGQATGLPFLAAAPVSLLAVPAVMAWTAPAPAGQQSTARRCAREGAGRH